MATGKANDFQKTAFTVTNIRHSNKWLGIFMGMNLHFNIIT